MTISEQKCLKSSKDSNFALYIAALALLISVLIAVFFFREFKKLKQDILQVRHLNSQLSELDRKYDCMHKAVRLISCPPKINSPIVTNTTDIKNENEMETQDNIKIESKKEKTKESIIDDSSDDEEEELLTEN